MSKKMVGEVVYCVLTCALAVMFGAMLATPYVIGV